MEKNTGFILKRFTFFFKGPCMVEREKYLRLCLVTVFVFYFQKLVLGNIKKKQFSYIFVIKKNV